MLQDTIKQLPIYQKQNEIVQSLKSHQVIIIHGETGSGKTTQVPKFCLQAGFAAHGKIAVTQPRRIAATAAAARVSEELGYALGTKAGYKVRFHEKLGEHTEILFMTDGMLLALIQSDRLLKQFQTIMIDEAHERSLNIDFLIGYIKKILPNRSDLKVIISSATIDINLFSRYFNNAPVIEVSGRVFPVDLWYQPLDARALDEGTMTYVDAAVLAALDIVEAGDSGDILVFMPSEHDILETVRKLKGKKPYHTIVLPLFARLTRSEQDRIFAPHPERKIVVATNIAETSLTIPRIRFVIDTGLARVNRYAPHLRTNRLPVEPISRASADQRKGRCGRVQDGLCIRLYSEEEYLGRDDYNTPEIKRSNLAGVILSMLWLRLGSIEEFPFLEPPHPKAIKDAYTQLMELGAIDSERRVTPLGEKMAHLPLEPHVSRMILAAEQERALREVTIIAAGLSIVDPRERPFEMKEKADLAHKSFTDPGSDFLSLLRLWDTYQHEWRALGTQNKMRKFCNEHFLSYNRMQEWHDVYRQIVSMLRETHQVRFNDTPADLQAVHRAILTGLISNIAYKKDTGGYTASKNREVYIFPGSSLFKQNPAWIMCQQVVETSKTFARTVAPIDPAWCEELAPHLCRRTYTEPSFDPKSMFVYAKETVFLFGLPVVKSRRVVYGKINTDASTDIFIREGLVPCALHTNHSFLKHNKNIQNTIASIRAKLRNNNFELDTELLVEFYKKRLTDISSIHDLNRIIKERGSDRFLYMKEKDIFPDDLPDTLNLYPDFITIGGKGFPLTYVFEPNSDKDGVTVTIPLEDMPFLNETLFTWIIPGLWQDKITWFLNSLPKNLQKSFIPLSAHSTRIAAKLSCSHNSFIRSMCDAIQGLYDLSFDPLLFKEPDLPAHLRFRIEIVDKSGVVIAAGRDIPELRTFLKNHKTPQSTSHFQRLFQRHERTTITEWTIGELPESIPISCSQNGIPVYGYPALFPDKECAHLKLFASPEEALKHHQEGVQKLLELALAKEAAWLEREIKFSQTTKLLLTPIGKEEQFKNAIIQIMKNHFFSIPDPAPRTELEFDTLLNNAKTALKGAAQKALITFSSILEQYHENEKAIGKKAALLNSALNKKTAEELKIRNRQFIARIQDRTFPYAMFLQLPRYLKALYYCIDKAFADMTAYNSRQAQIKAYETRAEEFLNSLESFTHKKKNQILEFIMLVEEFRISLFAQQKIATLYPVSQKRLQKKLEEIEE